jgi:hypothetical protein
MWLGNSVLVGNSETRRIGLGSIVVFGGLWAVGVWATRNQHRSFARRLLAPLGPAVDSDHDRRAALRAAGWYLAWAGVLGIGTVVALAGLTTSPSATVQALGLWMFPFTMSGAFLGLAAGLLLISKGLFSRPRP